MSPLSPQVRTFSVAIASVRRVLGPVLHAANAASSAAAHRERVLQAEVSVHRGISKVLVGHLHRFMVDLGESLLTYIVPHSSLVYGALQVYHSAIRR